MQILKQTQRLLYFQPRFNFYQKLYRTSKARENIFKENVEIRKLYDKKALPLYKKLVNKSKENKNKLILFAACCIILQFDWAYTQFLRILPYRKKWFLQAKSFCLGPETVYTLGVREQFFQNQFTQDFQEVFLKYDEAFPFGFTRKLIIRALKENQIYLDKKERKEFYENSGFRGLRGKVSSINLQELQLILKNAHQRINTTNISYQQFQDNMQSAIENISESERRWQIQAKRVLDAYEKSEMELNISRTKVLFPKIKEILLRDKMKQYDGAESDLTLPIFYQIQMLNKYLQKNEPTEELIKASERLNEDLSLRFKPFEYFNRYI